VIAEAVVSRDADGLFDCLAPPANAVPESADVAELEKPAQKLDALARTFAERSSK
jgi:hypothetical protein